MQKFQIVIFRRSQTDDSRSLCLTTKTKKNAEHVKINENLKWEQSLLNNYIILT